MKKQTVAMVAASALFVGACANVEERPGETFGTLIGAGLGAIAGSQIGGGKGRLVAIAVGTLAGAWAGSQLGQALDEKDREQVAQVAQDSLENNQSGASSTWANPDSGNSGSITPVNTYKTASGEDCRDFESTINVDGKTEAAQGRACRQPDGSWLIVQ